MPWRLVFCWCKTGKFYIPHTLWVHWKRFHLLSLRIRFNCVIFQFGEIGIGTNFKTQWGNNGVREKGKVLYLNFKCCTIEGEKVSEAVKGFAVPHLLLQYLIICWKRTFLWVLFCYVTNSKLSLFFICFFLNPKSIYEGCNN